MAIHIDQTAPDQPGEPDGHGHGQPGHGHHHHETPEQAASISEVLDLDAEVLADYLRGVTGWVAGLLPAGAGRVLDLGAGTGTGTVALAARFPLAQVYAFDVDESMLARVRGRAEVAGMADRVNTVRGDLDRPWPALEPVDLVWASSSLHEVVDSAFVLSSARAALVPGGVLVVIEIDDTPRFLPDDFVLGRPGLEVRLRAALDLVQSRWGHPDWASHLDAAGFSGVGQRTFEIDLPHGEATGRYARAYLARMRPALAEQTAAGALEADDLAVLDALLDDDSPESLLRRDDLHVRGSRTAWFGRA
ncbi:MAG: class I SAM-dependent methyltransferase [Burkholderiaceae bacterium]|nr:class I SAM-dependent methyltransferase [Microbacteriaceae bacterium]